VTKRKDISKGVTAGNRSVRRSTASVINREWTALTCASAKNAKMLKETNLAPLSTCLKYQKK
jgi:hypothetical protein